MSFTPNWNLETPAEGSLDWNVALNNNFTSIDSIVESLRNNFSSTIEETGPETHDEVGSLWYSLLQNPGEGLFIKTTIGRVRLMDQLLADTRYLKSAGDSLDGTLTFGQDGMFYFFNQLNSGYARIYFQTYNDDKNLTFEFGAANTAAIRFIAQTGTNTEVFKIGTDKLVAGVPLEVPTATQAEEAINKGQADLLYATIGALNSALERIATLEESLLP